MYRVQNEFYHRALTAPDQLRLRMVFALDQIWVISAQVVDNFQNGWMAYYLSLLDQNAFGNYRQLMNDITLSPGMGRYLDMAGNNRNHENENYAREILQLFDVGLDELNDDGTPMLDDSGQRVPSYNQDVIVAFSKVFTGGKLAPNVTTPPCSPSLPCQNWRDQMVLNQNNPNIESKTFVGGIPPPGPGRLPAKPARADDLPPGLDHTFYHPT